jgi:thiamine pyrophosphokinase
MKVLVLANGELYKPAILRKRIHNISFDLVLGADWGAHHAQTLGISLDAIIGDLDSTLVRQRPEINSARIIRYPAEKNEIDLELTLLYAREQGATFIVMVGVMGGRMDMAIANIMLMNHPSLNLCRVEAWHGNQTGWIIRPPGENVNGCPGDTISLVPISGDVSGIQLHGFKYPLNCERLALGEPRGLSNVIEQSTARIELAEGLLLAVHTPGRA